MISPAYFFKYVSCRIAQIIVSSRQHLTVTTQDDSLHVLPQPYHVVKYSQVEGSYMLNTDVFVRICSLITCYVTSGYV
jgi:hypothetical protein